MRRGLGRFLLATDVLDREALPAGEVLGRYKDQTRTVERGFRFLQDPLFFASSTFLKRPERVMAQRPTLRWVFQLFIWVRLVVLEGRPRVLNLAPHHETAVRLLGAQRYYLLE